MMTNHNKRCSVITGVIATLSLIIVSERKEAIELSKEQEFTAETQKPVVSIPTKISLLSSSQFL